MKRLILGGLSVLFVCAATVPAKASAKEEGSNKGACQPIPRPSPSGEAYLARLQAIQRCDTEARSRGPEMSSSLVSRQSNPPDEVLSPSCATAP